MPTPTHLSRHFEQQRRARDLRPGQLATLAGYTNPSKIGNRIRQFELSGDISKELFETLVVALEIDTNTIKRLVQLDWNDWWAWVNEPITPYLVDRLMATVYRKVPLPPEITTQDEAEAWAAKFASGVKRRCCLVWSRRISIYFNEEGNLSSISEAAPGRPNEPWMQIGGTKFLFGADMRSMDLVDRPKRPGE